jgi:hypothetical protein
MHPVRSMYTLYRCPACLPSCDDASDDDSSSSDSSGTAQGNRGESNSNDSNAAGEVTDGVDELEAVVKAATSMTCHCNTAADRRILYWGVVMTPHNWSKFKLLLVCLGLVLSPTQCPLSALTACGPCGKWLTPAVLGALHVETWVACVDSSMQIAFPAGMCCMCSVVSCVSHRAFLWCIGSIWFEAAPPGVAISLQWQCSSYTSLYNVHTMSEILKIKEVPTPRFLLYSCYSYTTPALPPIAGLSLRSTPGSLQGRGSRH